MIIENKDLYKEHEKNCSTCKTANNHIYTSFTPDWLIPRYCRIGVTYLKVREAAYKQHMRNF